MRSQTGTHWPTELQEQLLVAALADPEPAAAAWRAAQPRFSLDVLEQGSYDLLPLIYRNLAEAGLDDPLLPRLKGIYRKTWVTNNLLLGRTRETHAALEEAGLQGVFMEGVVAAKRFYPELGLRPSVVDVLVDVGDIDVAVAPLRRIGWRSPPGSPHPSARVAYLYDTAGNVCVLRTRLATDFVPRAARASAATFDGSHEMCEVDGVQVRVPGRTETLLAVVVLHARAGVARNVQWIADAKRVLEHDVDWDRLVELAERYQQTVRLRAALAYLAELPGARPPDAALDRMKRTKAPARERVGYRLTSGAIRGGGHLPFILAEHLASTADASTLRAAWAFPGELRRRWDLPRRRELPVAAGRRALRLLSTRKRQAG